MNDKAKLKQGRREQKRGERLQRIAGTGLQLFIDQGYESTTLDQVAEAAGISRRTFFYYFRSKEEILLAWEGHGFADALRPVLLEEGPDQEPLNAVRHCMLSLVSRYETPQTIEVDRLLNSTEALRARKLASFARMEEVLFGALCELWPDPDHHLAHRMLAMAAVGALRIALDE